MKIQVNGRTVLEMNETQEKVIQSDIPTEMFVPDMERRVRYIVEHKYEQCMERLKKEWEPILRKRVRSVPVDPDDYAELIFSQADYKSRSQKENERKLHEKKN